MTTTATTEPSVGSGPWSPLRIKVYRSLWIAGLVSNIGTFTHLLGAGWSMTTMSRSPTMSSLVQASWAIPGFILALHAGAIADRFDRRRVIIATQLAALAIAGALGVIELLDQMSPTMLLIGTFLESVALTIAAPAFMAFTPELVGLKNLAEAIGLDAISRNAAQAIAPGLAGLLIAAAGPGTVFLFNAVSFIGVVAVARAYCPPGRQTGQRDLGPDAIRAGLRYVTARVGLRHAALQIAGLSAVGAALAAVLPLVARGRLHVSPAGFGLLAAGLGVGSVFAVWGLPRIRSASFPARAVLGSAVTWSAGTALFAVSSQMWVAVPALFLSGAGAMGALSTLFTNYTVQLPNWVRGRGSAIAMLMVWLGVSAGAIAWGAIASAVGLRSALLMAAGTNVVVAAVANRLLPVKAASPADE
ncbi:MAG: MFS transporter [Actinomycetia bacterium]|nr:MFS transporter [Actinomycetes bacterium]